MATCITGAAPFVTAIGLYGFENTIPKAAGPGPFVPGL